MLLQPTIVNTKNPSMMFLTIIILKMIIQSYVLRKSNAKKNPLAVKTKGFSILLDLITNLILLQLGLDEQFLQNKSQNQTL